MRLFFISLLLLSAISLALTAAWFSNGAISWAPPPPRDTPQRLVEAWLRFHENDLCQGVDTVFIFDKTGMEAWCEIEDERSYQKLQELLEPLRSSYRIELYATRTPAEKKSTMDTAPPPSLWENYELRSYLGDPFARAKERRGNLDSIPEMEIPPPDEMLKRRLLVYTEQTIEWNRKMKRYAMDLPALAAVASDPAIPPELSSQANAVCVMHAQNLSRYIGKLAANLKEALPKSAKKDSPALDKSGNAGKVSGDSAGQICVAAQTVAGRVYHFIHPENYTVDLDELRQPGLLQALAGLDKMNPDFQKALAEPVRKQAMGNR